MSKNRLKYRCLGPTITPAKIERLKRELKNSPRFRELKRCCSAFAGKSRLDILYLLSRESELCVCDLADILSASISAISHQLRVLRKAGLVKSRRQAQVVFYSLAAGKKTQPGLIITLLNTIYEPV